MSHLLLRIKPKQPPMARLSEASWWVARLIWGITMHHPVLVPRLHELNHRHVFLFIEGRLSGFLAEFLTGAKRREWMAMGVSGMIIAITSDYGYLWIIPSFPAKHQ